MPAAADKLRSMTLQSMALSVRRDLARCEDLDEIAKLSGLSRSWLNQFARGVIKNPTINSLQSVMDAINAPKRGNGK